MMLATREIGALPEGQRNDGLTRLAGALRRKGMTFSEIEVELVAANDRRCIPPLSDEEVCAIAASVAQYPPGGPDPLDQAFAAIQGVYPSTYGRFLALCDRLQQARPEQPIALPLKRISILLGCSWTRVQQLRNRATKDGALEPVDSYIAHRRASTYRFTQAPSTTSRTSSSPWFSTSPRSKSPSASSAIAVCISPDEEQVLRLAYRGLRLFPCRPKSKVPLLKAWSEIATCETTRLTDWFQKYHGCNWACATGRGSGVWVLDIDGAHALEAAWRRFQEHGYIGPETLCTVTGREMSYHIFFAYPRDTRIRIRNSSGIKNWHEHLDVRGEGGYVMVPPSIWVDVKAKAEGRAQLPPRAYRFLQGDDRPVAVAPPWLLAMVGRPILGESVQTGSPTC